MAILPCFLPILKPRWIMSASVVLFPLHVLNGLLNFFSIVLLTYQLNNHLADKAFLSCPRSSNILALQYWMVNTKKYHCLKGFVSCNSGEIKTTEHIILSWSFYRDIWTRFILPLINRYPGCPNSAYDQMLLIDKLPFVTAYVARFCGASQKIHQTLMGQFSNAFYVTIIHLNFTALCYNFWCYHI